MGVAACLHWAVLVCSCSHLTPPLPALLACLRCRSLRPVAASADVVLN